LNGQLHVPRHFTAGETDPGTCWRGSWLGSKDGLGAVAKKKSLIIAPGIRITLIVVG